MVAGDGIEPPFIGQEPIELPLLYPAIYPQGDSSILRVFLEYWSKLLPF